MCGISGIYRGSDGPPVERRVLKNMLDIIRHRGPDDDGMFLAEQVGIGMRRLSIIDVAGGHQPITNEDGSVVVVFNGEIYNYRELAEGLRARGHRLATNSDTEVIVHLYEELGPECVHQFRGMFAFAIWDKRAKRLYIARDRLGIKPLYYTQVGETLVFGSEIKSLLQFPGVTAEPDLAAISNYISLKYVPAPQTMFAGIRSLPPGHTLTCDGNGMRIAQYWDVSFEGENDPRCSEEEYADRLHELLRESVRLRLRSDVPFGAFLSGGVDSSIIVALMSEMLDEPVKTFSVGFERTQRRSDELPYARQVAEQFGTQHHEVFMRPDEFVGLAEKVVWHLDQPIADQATMATYVVSRLAAQHVKMVLTGEGGDELFAGYARYPGERMSPLFHYLPGPVKWALMGLANRIPQLERPKIALRALCQRNEAQRMVHWFPLFTNDMRAELTRGEVPQFSNESAAAVFAACLKRTDARRTLNRMLYVDTKLWLADFLLLRGDKLTMANSLEGRVPLLDHKLVEFAASLPPRMKLKGMMRKYLLKKVARRYLPNTIVDRPKEGFPLPINDWFRGPVRTYIRDMLAPETIQRRGLFNAPYIEQMLQQHESGFNDHGALLWGLVCLEQWYRVFIDSTVNHTRRGVTSESPAPVPDVLELRS